MTKYSEIGNEDVVTASCDNTYDVLTPEICPQNS